MKTALLAGLLLVSSAAQAVTYYSLPGAPDQGPAPRETIIEDFEGTPVVSFFGSYSIQSGNFPGLAAPPAGVVNNYLSVPDAQGGSSSDTATIYFTDYLLANRPFRSLSFYWGSIDSYNKLEVLDVDGNVLQTLFGNDINNPADGNQTAPFSNQRVFLRFADGELASKLRLTSTGRAFEIDDIAGSAVPEPATWAMLLAGFGLVGFAARRRRFVSTATS